MLAATPVRDGHVQRGGVRSFFEVYGDGAPGRRPADARLEHAESRVKAPNPVPRPLAGVVVADPPENGLSGRPVSVDETN